MKTITMQEIKQASGIRKAALVHVRFFYMQSERWLDVRDNLIDAYDPEWPHENFWNEVDKALEEYEPESIPQH